MSYSRGFERGVAEPADTSGRHRHGVSLRRDDINWLRSFCKTDAPTARPGGAPARLVLTDEPYNVKIAG